MPKINIVQRDFTTPAQTVNNENIVLVPVWSWSVKKKNTEGTEEVVYEIDNNPKLFRTLEDLKGVTIGDSKGANYVNMILHSGLPVLLYGMSNSDSSKTEKPTNDEAFYTKLATIFADNNMFSELGNFDFKFITSGGYTTFNKSDIDKSMLKTAAMRGDCLALIDYSGSYSDIEETLNPTGGDTTARYKGLTVTKIIDGETVNVRCDSYGALIAGNGKYTFNGVVLDNIPSSFAYLSCLGNSIRTNPDHLAIAGVTRGKVLYNFEPNQDDIITNKEAEDYQPKNGVRVNPITNIRPYGYCIWGNATLRDNGYDEVGGEITGDDGLVASSYLNIRNMVSTVQKAAYSASKACMFEQNTDTLWVKFQNLLMPTLDNIKSNNGISNYKIIKKQIPQSYKMSAIIKLYPIYAVDEIDIEIQLRDSEEI